MTLNEKWKKKTEIKIFPKLKLKKKENIILEEKNQQSVYIITNFRFIEAIDKGKDKLKVYDVKIKNITRNEYTNGILYIWGNMYSIFGKIFTLIKKVPMFRFEVNIPEDLGMKIVETLEKLLHK